MRRILSNAIDAGRRGSAHRGGWAAIALGCALVLTLGGCPQIGLPPTEYVAGTTGQTAQLATTPSVDVLAPVSDFSITGGTPVEVVWRTVASSRLATIEVFIDLDQNPDNGNEIVAQTGLPLTESTEVLNTSDLAAGRYFIGVRQRSLGNIVAFDYATGRITVDQRPTLFFTSPRDNLVFDRTPAITPTFTVSWTVNDPDSVVSTQIFLDPDSTPNGNEILLRESNSQTSDTFTFDLPTGSLEAGRYRILAIVSDGLNTFPFYAPGGITLRARLAGYIDLRDLEQPRPASPLRGAVFEGFNPRDNAGSKVAAINDLDGDGFDDFIIAAQFGKPSYGINVPRTGVGEAYLIYGRQQRFTGRINLNSTGTLFRGEIFAGVPEVADPIRPSRGITDIVALDDWDRDGVRELAFGLPFTDSLKMDALAGVGVGDADRGPLDPNGYFRSGGVIICAGSVFRPDLGFPGRNAIALAEIGTRFHRAAQRPPQCFEGFYGPKAPPGILIGGGDDADPLNVTFFHQHLLGVDEFANRLGARFSTIDFADQCGETLSRYEFDGIIISTPNRDASAITQRLFLPRPGAGVVSVFFNNTGEASYQWENANAPPATANYLGPQVNSATGGIPHGGPYHYILDDLRIYDVPIPVGTVDEGPDGFTNMPFSPGYVATNDSQPCGSPPDFGAAPSTLRTARFYGGFEGARLGNAVSTEDFNADGIDDILIGSPLTNGGAGAVFIVLGRLRELVRGGDLNIEELGLPLAGSPGQQVRLFDGIRVVGAPGDRLGQSQDSAGDFNGDGISDVVIGSSLINNRRGGATVFFGSREVINLTESEIPFAEIPSRGLGVNFVGEDPEDLAGARVKGVRDVDGDGLDDILIAAPNRSIRRDLDLDGTIDLDRQNCGVVYLIYGSSQLRGTISLSAIGTRELPGAVFIGPHSAAFLGAGLGEQGDMSQGIGHAGDVDGDGNVDLLISSVTATPRGGRVAAGEAYLIYGVSDPTLSGQ